MLTFLRGLRGLFQHLSIFCKSFLIFNKTIMKKINFLAIPITAIAFCTSVSTLLAQDPVHVDAKHYKVVAENNDVRVLRIKYGPGEKSVMHFHPESAVVFLTDIKVNLH